MTSKFSRTLLYTVTTADTDSAFMSDGARSDSEDIFGFDERYVQQDEQQKKVYDENGAEVLSDEEVLRSYSEAYCRHRGIDPKDPLSVPQAFLQVGG